ncbi:YceI family protein [Altererythrobacter fulvus]|uniref:YceI family protein n=1 Tax=Caenibius fulvus TaxID=2126012 RepID=UPI00301670F9
MRKVQMGIAALTGAALLYVVGAQAQNGDLGSPGKADASVVTAGTYAADPGHTLVGWKVNHFGFSDYFGLFGDVKGTLKLDPANIAASSVEVTIPVGKVTTANAGLTAHLLAAGKDGKAPDFFGASPADATFKSTSVKSSGGNKATITGDLTLNGVTKPVTINAEFVGAGANPYSKKETVGFKGTARIKRSEFGINFAAPAVTDTVDLDIAAAFEKQ